MNVNQVIKELERISDKNYREGAKRFKCDYEHSLGVPIPKLRFLARKIGKNHKLALGLWKTDINEARILASMIDEPEKVTEDQMKKWVKDFWSWGLCDQVCSNLFDKTPFAHKKAIEWTKRKEEFVKRAGFTLMATLAVHDKKADNKEFIKFLPIIKRESTDERNFVKKAVNWALRQIGKRNKNLNRVAIKAAKEIRKIDSKSARWIASDTLRELESRAVQKRLKN